MKILLALLLISTALFAQKYPMHRPRILGVAHVAFYVSDLAKARAFYKDFLGFAEPFAIERENGTERIVFIKVNDEQYLTRRKKTGGSTTSLSIPTMPRACATILALKG